MIYFRELLGFIIVALIYIFITVLLALSPLGLSESRTVIGLIQLCNVGLTATIFYLIFRKRNVGYLNALLGTVIVSNSIKAIVNIIDGEISFAHIALLVTAIYLFWKE